MGRCFQQALLKCRFLVEESVFSPFLNKTLSFSQVLQRQMSGAGGNWILRSLHSGCELCPEPRRLGSSFRSRLSLAQTSGTLLETDRLAGARCCFWSPAAGRLHRLQANSLCAVIFKDGFHLVQKTKLNPYTAGGYITYLQLWQLLRKLLPQEFKVPQRVWPRR